MLRDLHAVTSKNRAPQPGSHPGVAATQPLKLADRHEHASSGPAWTHSNCLAQTPGNPQTPSKTHAQGCTHFCLGPTLVWATVPHTLSHHTHTHPTLTDTDPAVARGSPTSSNTNFLRAAPLLVLSSFALASMPVTVPSTELVLRKCLLHKRIHTCTHT